MVYCGCFGKTPYATPKEAYSQLTYRAKRKTKKKNNRGNGEVYRCCVCKSYHVGTSFDFD